MNFKSFLTESLDVEKLKHLEHAEDHIIHGGHEGVSHTAETLSDVSDFLSGKKTKTKITTKYDGAPSIVFGIDPETGKFFVGSKSVFNVHPKLNFSDEDIEKNHGHAPGLVEKLKAALHELPKIMPKSGGVYQGDLMYTKPDLKDDKSSYSFTPNTITYTADKDSANGRKVAASQLGIVVHTKYTGKRLADMKASFDVDHNSFGQDPDVNMINPEVKSGQISGIEKKKYEAKMKEATDLYSKMDHDIFNTLDGHEIPMKTYINQCVRDETTPNAKGYRSFIESKFGKELEKLKSDSARQKKQEQTNTMLDHLDSHKKQFDDLFKLHKTIQEAKDSLVGALARTDTGFKTTIGDKETKPEGFVAIRGGRPTKLVDRAEFSRLNFAMGSFRKGGPEETDTYEPQPEEPVKKRVFTFGRMNPPTIGHRKLSDKVQEVAKEHGAEHEIVLSHSQDPEKNPLTGEQKQKHAQKVLGKTARVKVTSDKEPNVIQVAKRYEKEGVNHLIMVVGSDRVDEFKKLLDSYNGKEYNFKKIDVVSAGTRDPDAEGVEGMSASKMREHAINRRLKDFKKGLPSDVSHEDAMSLFKDTQAGMDIKIGPETNGISLARYAKRNDPVGVKARKEQDRRLRMKALEKQQKATSKAMRRKSIKEEMMTTGDVRGLGFISGNPMVDSNFQTVWATLNQSDADTRDQIMNQSKKSNHDDLHINIEQKRDAAKSLFVSRVMDSIRAKNN
jgi:hypothetical protein